MLRHVPCTVIVPFHSQQLGRAGSSMGAVEGGRGVSGRWNCLSEVTELPSGGAGT